VGSEVVRFFQNSIKVVTYAPHITCSSRNTVKEYNRWGKISFAVRIKASVNVVALNAKDLARSLKESVKKRPPQRPFRIVTMIGDETQFEDIG
jgi:hypothetical protein